MKSLHFAEDLARLPGSPRLERFQLQLRWYMHAVAAAEGREVAGRLILADIETGATKILDVAHDPEKTLPDLVRRTRLLLDAFLEERALAEAKAAEAATLVFPHETLPPGPARDGGRGGARGRAGRAPPRRGADGHREDRRRRVPAPQGRARVAAGASTS